MILRPHRNRAMGKLKESPPWSPQRPPFPPPYPHRHSSLFDLSYYLARDLLYKSIIWYNQSCWGPRGGFSFGSFQFRHARCRVCGSVWAYLVSLIDGNGAHVSETAFPTSGCVFLHLLLKGGVCGGVGVGGNNTSFQLYGLFRKREGISLKVFSSACAEWT